MHNQKIAIIGAGAAGLTAAHQLSQSGYNNVTVFEKEQEVGGKVSTFSLNGRHYEIGAIWTTSDYQTIHRISQSHRVRQHSVDHLDIMTQNGKVMNAILHALKKNNPALLARDAINFYKLIRRFPRIKKPGFNEYHPDFYLTVEELSRKYNFMSMTTTMAPTMSACGYGFYEEIPALYWMKLMVLLLNFGLRGGQWFGNLQSFDKGFQSLWQDVANALDVRVGSPVTAMKRSRKGQGAKIEITTGSQTEIFDKVIIASPLETAHRYLDQSVPESELFQKIRTLRYIVSVVQSDSRAHVAFTKNTTPNRLGHVNAAVKAYPDSDVCVYYQLVDQTTSPPQALETLRQDLAEVGIGFSEVYLQKVWDYFPHVVRQDLEQGFYDKLESLQGQQGTYYVGSLLSFETVEHTAAYSENLIGRFF